jgi:hypothetical protein
VVAWDDVEVEEVDEQGQQEWWGVEAEGCGGWFCWFYVLVFCWFFRFFVADSVMY